MSNNEPITLEYPVEHGGAKYTVVKVRRHKVRDMRRAQGVKGSEADREIALFADLCEIPPEVIDELDFKDYEKIKERFESFTS